MTPTLRVAAAIHQDRLATANGRRQVRSLGRRPTLGTSRRASNRLTALVRRRRTPRAAILAGTVRP